jgi:hypothetical protein
MEQHDVTAEAGSRLKRAELASTFGASLLGGGLGVLAAPYAADLTLSVLVAGVLMHGWGMYDKHAIERDLGRPEAPWMKVLLLAVLGRADGTGHPARRQGFF